MPTDHTDKETSAMQFAEFCADNYTRVQGKWIDLGIGVLVHGSEDYYKKLAKEHGKTTKELFDIYNQ